MVGQGHRHPRPGRPARRRPAGAFGQRGPGYDEPVYVISVAADLADLHPQTLRAYRNDLAQFGEYLAEERRDGKAPAPEKIDALAVRGFVARLSRAGLGKSSIARKLSAVRSFLRHAVREGRLLQVIDLPHIERRLVRHDLETGPRVAQALAPIRVEAASQVVLEQAIHGMVKPQWRRRRQE